MDKAIYLGLARHLLTFGGGVLVSKGMVDPGSLEQLIGAVITIGGIIWSALEKKPAAK